MARSDFCTLPNKPYRSGARRAPCARTAGPWAVRERRRFTAEPVGARANPGHGTPAASDLELGRTAALPDTRRLPQSPERAS